MDRIYLFHSSDSSTVIFSGKMEYADCSAPIPRLAAAADFHILPLREEISREAPAAGNLHYTGRYPSIAREIRFYL